MIGKLAEFQDADIEFGHEVISDVHSPYWTAAVMHRRSRTRWLAILLLACSGTAGGQESELPVSPVFREPREVFGEAGDELETDRDSFTPSTTVVGRGRQLVETSYSFIDNRESVDSHSFPELLARIGLTENVEFRVGWNYEIGGGGAVSNSGSPAEPDLLGGQKEEEANLLYGMKVSLTEQNRWLPQSALIVQASTPTAGPETATQFSTGYVFGWTLPRAWGIDSALRYAAATDEGDHHNLWSPSIVLKVPVRERWKAHVEYFGIFSEHRENERNAQYLSPGIHYLLTRDFEVGVRMGWGLNHDSANYFTNIGAGVRY